MDEDFIKEYDELCKRELSEFDKEESSESLDDYFESLQSPFDEAVKLSNKIERTTVYFDKGIKVRDMFNIDDKYIYVSETRTLYDIECLSYSIIKQY